MKTGAQKIAEMIGKSGCLMLSYIKLVYMLDGTNIDDGQLLADAVTSYDFLLNKGIIDAECYVNDPIKLIESVFPSLNRTLSIEKTYEIPKDAPEYIISYNGKHFTIAKNTGEIVWDSFGAAHIKKTMETPAKSYRILRMTFTR